MKHILKFDKYFEDENIDNLVKKTEEDKEKIKKTKDTIEKEFLSTNILEPENKETAKKMVDEYGKQIKEFDKTVSQIDNLKKSIDKTNKDKEEIKSNMQKARENNF